MSGYNGLQFDSDADDYVVLHINTTGTKITTDTIVEAAALRVRSCVVVDTFQGQLPLTGIVDFIGDDIIVSNRAKSFTLKFLDRALIETTGFGLNNDYIDLLSFAKVCLEDRIESYTLNTIATYLEVSERENASALSECLQVYKCYTKLTEIFRSEWDEENLYKDYVEAFHRIVANSSAKTDPVSIRNTLEYINSGAEYDPLLRCCILLPLIKYELDNNCFEEFLEDELHAFAKDIKRGMYKRESEEGNVQIQSVISYCLQMLNR